MLANTCRIRPEINHACSSCWPEAMEPGKSSSTVGQSRESLARGADILGQVVKHGVVKTEEPSDEAEIQRQIEARLAYAQTILIREARNCLHQVLRKQQALLQEAKAGEGFVYANTAQWIELGYP